MTTAQGSGQARRAIGERLRERPTAWVSALGLLAVAVTTVGGLLDVVVAAPLAGALWALGLVAVERLRAATVIAVAALLYGALATTPFHSRDLHRYLWEGHVQLAGYSPYALAPASPELTALRDARFEKIVHPELPTLYPPLAQASFALAASLDWDEVDLRNVVLALQLLLAVAVCLWLSRTGRPPGRAAWLAWSPVAIASAATGHIDVLMALALVGFVWAWESGRVRLAAACLALAALAKTVALILLPWLLWRRPRAVWTTALPILVLGVLPYVWAGGLQGSLLHFAREFAFNAALHEVLGAFAGNATTAVAGVLLLAWLGFVTLRVDDVVEASVLSLVGLLLLAPTVHYWYLTWWLALLPALSARWWRAPLLAWAGSITLIAPLYAAAVRGETYLPADLYASRVGLEYAIPVAVAVFACAYGSGWLAGRSRALRRPARVEPVGPHVSRAR